jgi:predicted nucleotidyltransferase
MSMNMADETTIVDPLIRERRADILRMARAHGATNIRVFGSRARGTARPDSDLDILINLEPGRHLFDLVAIKLDLQDLLGHKVHVVTEGGISRYIRDEVMRDAVPL